MKASLCQFLFIFVKTLGNSKKKCVASLANRVCNDQNSITKKNLNVIEEESNCIDILSLNPCFVSSQIRYAPIPNEEMWRVSLLEELIQIRSHDSVLEGFSKKEIDELILSLTCEYQGPLTVDRRLTYLAESCHSYGLQGEVDLPGRILM